MRGHQSVPVIPKYFSKIIQATSSLMTSFWRKENTPINGQATLTTQKCDHLAKLNLSRFIFDEQKLIIKILGTCRKLIKLDLTSCAQLTDEVLKYFPTTLQFLNLSECDITDQTLMLLQPLANLKSLNLNFCAKITNEDLKHLKMLSSLKELSLIGCNQITKAGHEHLKPLVPIQRLDLSNLTLKTLRSLPNIERLSITVLNDS